jgi:hypothetical protein
MGPFATVSNTSRCLIHRAHLRFWLNFWEFSLMKYIQFCAEM